VRVLLVAAVCACAYRTPLERQHATRQVEVEPGVTLHVLDLDPELPRAVLFVPGDAGVIDFWTPQLRHLRGRYRLIVVEREDCGRSSAPDTSYSASARRLEKLVQQLGARRWAYVGHSRGQEIGAFVLADAPPGLVGYVASGSAIQARLRPPEPVDPEAARAECRAMLEAKSDVIGAALGLAAGDMAALREHACNSWRPSLCCADRDITAELARTTLHVLQIDGDRAARRPDALASYVPDAELLRIADAGHIPSLEQPEAFNRALDAYLAGLAWR
jgi:3-oxoadipate enol-lactonase